MGPGATYVLVEIGEARAAWAAGGDPVAPLDPAAPPALEAERGDIARFLGGA